MAERADGTEAGRRLRGSGPEPCAQERRRTGRVGDLRRAQPADATTRNLLALVLDKLETCASLPVYEWEAANQGHERVAAAFRTLAETERRSCNDLLDCLRDQLGRGSGEGG